MNLPAINAIDIYKADHRRQYPEGTSRVFSNWTARHSRVEGVNHTVHFGLQFFCLDYLIDAWNRTFFSKPKEKVVSAYRRRLRNAGITVTVEHVAALHDLGYLPLEIWGLPEGTHVPIGVPSFVVWNTHDDFAWVTNYIETVASNSIWGPTTSATIAGEYRKLLDYYTEATGADPAMVPWLGHDFSCRGMYGPQAAAMSGAGHLLFFTGTDTVQAIDFLETFYFANSDEEMIGASVPATEHSVMCMGEKEHEAETYRRLITEVYPTGIVSIVSDTWDYWRVWGETLPDLKGAIMARDGKVVIRPDSGDPVKILCGDPEASALLPRKGTVEVAYDLFGGTLTKKGYMQLDPHIGTIYGDSITLKRAYEICDRLMAKGFCPVPVLGIGSFTYQYNTRDTFGFAMKATAGVVDGETREIFKDPKTDSGVKKSAKGYVAVVEEAGTLVKREQVTLDAVRNCAFLPIFRDGAMVETITLAEVRANAIAGLRR